MQPALNHKRVNLQKP